MPTFANCYGFPFDRFKSAFSLYATFGALAILAPAIVSQIISFIVAFTVAFLLAATSVASGTSGDAVPLISQIIGNLMGSLAYIPTMPFYPAFFRCLDTEAQGGTAPVERLFAWRGLVGPSIAAGVLMWIILFAGFLFCIVPGLLLLPLSVLPFYFVSRGDKGTAAISRFFGVLGSQPMTLLYAWGMFVPLMLLGYLTCCFGVIVTYPMFVAAMYFMVRGIPIDQRFA